MLDKLLKIKKYIKGNYYLSINFDGKYIWKLYSVKNDMILNEYSPIMTSEKNTYEELLKFAKEHRIYDISNVFCITATILNLIMLMFSIVNYIFIENDFISKILLGSTWTIFLFALIMAIFNFKNYKTIDKIFSENSKLLIDRLTNDINSIKKETEENIEKLEKENNKDEENERDGV